MTRVKTLLAASAAAFSLSAQAEIESSMYLDVATQFLDRGQVFGGPAAFAGISFEHESGLYAGVDALAYNDNEVDYVLGYGGEFGGIGIDAAFVDINFPSDPADADVEELLVELTYSDFALFFVDGLTDGINKDYRYISLSYAYEDFTFTYGEEDAGFGAADEDYTHVNVAYAYNDRITATLVVPVDSGLDRNAGGNDELQFVVGYSVPLD